METRHRVWLIRHGESESNAGLPTAAPAPIALTARGIEQSRYLASAFPTRPSLIVTSPYIRTKQTTQFTIDRFYGVRHEEWSVQEFTYLSLPPDQPTTMTQRWPRVEAYWARYEPHYVDGPGAESFSSLLDRASSLIDVLSRREEEFVAIFTHGHFMRAVMWTLILGSVPRSSESMIQFRSFLSALPMPNGAIVKLHFNKAGERFISRPDTSHLPAELMTSVVSTAHPRKVFSANHDDSVQRSGFGAPALDGP